MDPSLQRPSRRPVGQRVPSAANTAQNQYQRQQPPDITEGYYGDDYDDMHGIGSQGRNFSAASQQTPFSNNNPPATLRANVAANTTPAVPQRSVSFTRHYNHSQNTNAVRDYDIPPYPSSIHPHQQSSSALPPINGAEYNGSPSIPPMPESSQQRTYNSSPYQSNMRNENGSSQLSSAGRHMLPTGPDSYPLVDQRQEQQQLLQTPSHSSRPFAADDWHQQQQHSPSIRPPIDPYSEDGGNLNLAVDSSPNVYDFKSSLDIDPYGVNGSEEYYPLTDYNRNPSNNYTTGLNGNEAGFGANVNDIWYDPYTFEGITGNRYNDLNGEGDDDAINKNLYSNSQKPSRQPRRFKTVKRVELYNGNLVLDCPVPNKLLSALGRKEDREFTHMRYTAATCDPSEFKSERFTLRQVLYEQPRTTELFIVITMYNENEVLFARTLHGVMKNIKHLCSRDRSKVWGKEGWRKVVVCVVADGRSKIHPRTLAVLAALGVYQDGVAKNVVNGKPVTAHIYEYTTQIDVDPDLKFQSSEKGVVPCQIIFCLKEKNQKKINSHRWFFQAFAPILQPNICVLLDTGTRPGATSIYHLWKAFDVNVNVAGACGEIVAMKGPGGVNLLNPLVAAQNFEYKMSNILDKPLESVFGFITVLPGAFSAYRFLAIQNDSQGRGPLASYFKGESMHGADAGIFEANMYLAEDRILCFELIAKRKCAWILKYVKSAYAETDVPDRLDELISQRRRWLNGSFFAAVYAISHAFSVWRTDHNVLRKLMFHFEFFYLFVSMVFSWFGLVSVHSMYSICFIIFVLLLASH